MSDNTKAIFEEEPFQTISEEVANSVIHGIGFFLSIAGLVVLVAQAVLKGTTWHVVGFSIFGAALILLYMVSTLYHSIQHPTAKMVLRRLDHISIYFLIAGSYTPYALTILRGGHGWTLFGIEWGIALIGIIFKAVFGPRYNNLSTWAYVIMGWMIIIAAKPMIMNYPMGGIIWLFLGGLFYTVGVPFYLKDTSKKYFHAIWHVFVLGGSICHFFGALFYLLP